MFLAPKKDSALWAVRMHKDPLTESGGFTYALCDSQCTAVEVFHNIGGGAFGERIVRRESENSPWQVWEPE